MSNENKSINKKGLHIFLKKNINLIFTNIIIKFFVIIGILHCYDWIIQETSMFFLKINNNYF